MFKKKRKEVKDFQERTTFKAVKILARNNPEIFNGWSDDKLMNFVKYCINPKRVNVPKSVKEEFDRIGDITPRKGFLK